MATTVTWTSPDQWGAYGLSSGVWTDVNPDDTNGDVTVQEADSAAGFIFDATDFQTLNFATVGGILRPLDAPIMTGFQLDFYVTRVGGSVSPWEVEVLLIQEPAPEDFATNDGPTARSYVSLGTFDLGTVPALPDTLHVTLTFDDDAGTLLRGHVLASGKWSGRLALGMISTPGSGRVRLKNGPSFPFKFVTSQTPFFSGISGGYQPRARAVRDTRFGVPTLSSRLVRDEDSPGLWVRPSDQDPEDPATEYVPDPMEGVVDDEIPS